jgi:hypothetical protein
MIHNIADPRLNKTLKFALLWSNGFSFIIWPNFSCYLSFVFLIVSKCNNKPEVHICPKINLILYKKNVFVW